MQAESGIGQVPIVTGPSSMNRLMMSTVAVSATADELTVTVARGPEPVTVFGPGSTNGAMYTPSGEISPIAGATDQVDAGAERVSATRPPTGTVAVAGEIGPGPPSELPPVPGEIEIGPGPPSEPPPPPPQAASRTQKIRAAALVTIVDPHVASRIPHLDHRIVDQPRGAHPYGEGDHHASDQPVHRLEGLGVHEGDVVHPDTRFP